MQLTVIRKTRTDKSTVGQLNINGNFFAYTLEDKDRGLRQSDDIERIREIKVKRETAIPSGTYTVVMNFSNTFQKYMPQILTVPGFEGVRIHGGNTASNTEGCILIGLEKVNDDTIRNCPSACASLYAAIKKVEKTEKILITIDYEAV